MQRRSLVLPRRRLETRPRRSKSALVVGTVHHSGEREVLSRHTRTPPTAAASCTSSLQHRSVIRWCLFRIHGHLPPPLFARLLVVGSCHLFFVT